MRRICSCRKTASILPLHGRVPIVFYSIVAYRSIKVQKLDILRPGSFLAISAHLGPISAYKRSMVSSSSRLKGALLRTGLTWLCHLSRHCFPVRLPSREAMTTHFSAPSSFTRASKRRSSEGVHGPLIGFGVGVAGEDARIWKVAAAARADADADDGVQIDMGVRIPACKGVIGVWGS